MSEDPVWSTNLYPYADNNPISFFDVDGRVKNSCAKFVRQYFGWKQGTTPLAAADWATDMEKGLSSKGFYSLQREWYGYDITQIKYGSILVWSRNYFTDFKKGGSDAQKKYGHIAVIENLEIVKEGLKITYIQNYSTGRRLVKGEYGYEFDGERASNVFTWEALKYMTIWNKLSFKKP
jgi:hypothetical protein